jgi:hypothetical protein
MIFLKKIAVCSIPIYLICVTAICAAEPPAANRVAEDPPAGDTAKSPAKKPVLAGEVRRLVAQLDSNRFAERKAASEQLRKMGLAAVQPLADAAPRGSLELQQRAMKLLEDFYRSRDKSLCTAAQGALEGLRQSEQESIARRAVEILKFPPYGLKPGNWLGRGLVHGLGGTRPLKLGGGGGIVIGGGQVRLGNGAQIVVSGVENGHRFVDIIQGSGLGVLILENEKSGMIDIHTCQQQAAGQAEYQRYEAHNAAELQQKHPKIHAFYDRFKGYRGGMVMNGAVAIQ